MRVLQLFILLFIFCGYSYGTTENDYSMIKDKIRTDNVVVNADSIVSTVLTCYSDDGSFNDIDYTLKDRTVWPPIEHLDRLIAMAYAYNLESGQFSADELLLSKIEKSLRFWYNTNPVSDNRWWWLISEPQKLGLLFIALEEAYYMLDKDLVNNILKRWAQRGGNPAEESGGNQVDVALHCIYRACLTENEELLGDAIKYIFESIKYVTEGDGIRIDNSYLAHGPQLHIGGYGETQLYGQTPVAYYLHGSRFQLDDDKVRLLSNYIRNTFMKCIRGEVMAYNAHGRGISRKDYLKRTDRWNKIIKTWREVDLNHAQKYDDFLKRINGMAGAVVDTYINNFYYNADFFIHERPNYTFTVRFSSTRTVRSEYGNNENLKGYFICDGSTCLQETGHEYENIMPLWNWNYLPGTTAPKLEEVPLPASEWGVYGTSTFCGGTSDGKYGLACYSYYDNFNNINTGGKKGWFFFDDAIVCLGSDLLSSHEELVTCVEQNWGDSFFNVLNRNGSWSKQDELNSDEVLCVQHKNIAYYFPYGGHVVSCIENRKGAWYDINKSESNEELEGNVFNLKLANALPENNSYSYMILPNTSQNLCVDKIESLGLKILENNDSIQAVYDTHTSITEAVFYKAATLTFEGIQIKSFQPCAVLLKQTAVGDSLYTSDPSHNNETIAIGYKRGYSDIEIKEALLESDQQLKGKPFVFTFSTTPTPIMDLGIENEDTTNTYKTIYNIEGRQLGIFGKGNNNLAPGLYIIKTFAGGHSEVKKIIVK